MKIMSNLDSFKTDLPTTTKSPYTKLELDVKYKLVRLYTKCPFDNSTHVILNLNNKQSFISQLGNMINLLYPYTDVIGYILIKLKYWADQDDRVKDLLPKEFYE